MASSSRILLVTGATGFLGWNLRRVAQEDWRLVAAVHRRSLEGSAHGVVPMDLADPASVAEAFKAVRPDAVIHAAAFANPNECEAHPDDSARINRDAAIEIARRCGERRIPCLFTSTDLVFDGHHAPYDETAVPAPISCYGRHKTEAERAMRDLCPELGICRLPLMFGDAGPGASSILQPMLAALRGGKPLPLFTDEFRTPALGADVAVGLFLALAKRPSLVHLGGPERINRYEFGRRVCRRFGFSESLLLPRTRSEVPMAAARPADVSLDSRRAAGLGYRPRPVDEALRACEG